MTDGNKGFIRKGDHFVPDDTKPIRQQAIDANANAYDLEYRTLRRRERSMPDAIPVGAILPFWGPWTFPSNWQLCIGQTLNDPESPFHQQKLPDLCGCNAPHKTTYLAGTLDSGEFRQNFGRNTIPNDGPTSHTFAGHPEGRGTRTGDRRYKEELNAHPQHDHGGENRPYSYGVVYLIRVK